ncbi:MAG TPA: 4-(cytidine 5'-diphospho)-2-C-methyl-D-erythritol kinase [Bacillota bacterium]|nr:4-(cytidine 5'-diphospho)-2-C-methyl-D-erythritol kinase [Bacillota bacterium]
MAESVQIIAPAKINLSLDVLGKREDGYHQVSMIMQTISLADTITLEKTARGISLTCDNPALPVNEGNLAYRAAVVFKQATGYSGGVEINISKRIPVEAGLAGGSTDAAAVLKGLNDLTGNRLEDDQLRTLGAALGSDVPFCISGGTALATGRGELIQPLRPVPQLNIIVVKPPFGVSTAKVYGRLDLKKVTDRPDTEAMLEAIAAGDAQRIIALGANVLESVTLKEYPPVEILKNRLKQLGAEGVLMSGSGPTVFGFVKTPEQGQAIAGQIGDLGQAWVVTTL